MDGASADTILTESLEICPLAVTVSSKLKLALGGGVKLGLEVVGLLRVTAGPDICAHE